LINSIRNASHIRHLLHPRSIAVIGATDKPERIGHIIYQQLKHFEGRVYTVNPLLTVLGGQSVYSRVEDLPEPVDLAVIAIGSELAVEAAERCAKQGIPQCIIVASGFREVGPQGCRLEERLKEIPAKYGTRILGPNTLGVFIPGQNLDTIFVEHGDKALADGGGVAFISQSGSVGVEALGLASNTGFGMRAFIGLGNKCDLDELDFLDFFARDPQTTCLAFYLENMDHGRDFLLMARNTAPYKPIVVLKAGRSETGADAVTSHTGRLAGSDQVVSGAFRQFGIQRVFDDEELCDAAKVLSMLPPAPGNRVAVLSPAGGYGVMAADHIELYSGSTPLKMARLSPKTTRLIRKAAPFFAAIQNPVDLSAAATDHMYGEALDALLEDPGVDIIICIAFFAPPLITDELVNTIVARAVAAAKPVIMFTQYGPFTDDYLLHFHKAGVVGFPSIGRAVRAARFLVERATILTHIRQSDA
jgi:acyl-CoA synthetase (NDP forming)